METNEQIEQMQSQIIKLDKALEVLKEGLQGVRSSFIWQGSEAKHDPGAGTSESFQVAHNREMSVLNIENMIKGIDALRADNQEKLNVALS